MLRIIRFCLFLYLLGATAATAQAHLTGELHLSAEPVGDFLLTVWTAPDPLRTDDFHVIVGVSDPAGQNLILDAEVMVTVAKAGRPEQIVDSDPATREKSDNRFLYEAYLYVDEPGDYLVTVEFSHPDGEGGSLSLIVSVERASPINWFWVGMGAATLLIVAFTIWSRRASQESRLRRRRRQAAPEKMEAVYE